MVLQLLAAGIVSGSIYALIGLGLTVGFKATEVITFAHGIIVALGAYFGILATTTLGLNYGFALIFAFVCVTIVAWIADRLVYSRLLDAPHMIQVLATLGVANLIKGGIILAWGTDAYSFPLSPRMDTIITSPVVLTGQQILVVVASFAAMACLTGFFGATWWGWALRAASQNRIGANLCGVRSAQVFSLGNVISAMLGALAGVLYGPLTLVDPSLDWVLVKGFAVAAIGGLTSIPGTVLGGLLLGLTESLWSSVFPALWAPVVSYLLITIVLLVKPSGLFGGSTRQKL